MSDVQFVSEKCKNKTNTKNSGPPQKKKNARK